MIKFSYHFAYQKVGGGAYDDSMLMLPKAQGGNVSEGILFPTFDGILSVQCAFYLSPAVLGFEIGK